MLDDLALFVRIVESGSLSAAGQKLGVPAATLTRRLQKLEADLGCKLLHRSARRLLPTSEGWQYYERCRPLLASLQQATQALDVALNQVSGSIRLLAPVTLANALYRDAWAGFLARYPDIRLEMRLANEVEDLLERGADLALRVGELTDVQFNQRRLGDTRVVLVAAPAYLDRHGQPQHPDQLAEHALLLAESLPQWALVKRQNGERWSAPIPATPRVRLNEMQLAVDLAIAGLGILYCPLPAALAALSDGRLRHALPDWRGEARPVYAVWPQQRALPARVRALVDYLIEFSAAQPLMRDGDIGG
ncbi:MAG: LysR family transcriptional regulator [Rhodocyclales bacterium GT-UBC]|nr:MAG: LysR family transcriptional regulator [Rhodocyclales bacterium GT-UBC]